MPFSSIDTILSAKVITRVVSRIAATSNSLLNFFGAQVGGPNVKTHGHRQFLYDVFNYTRTVGSARAPGANAAKIARQKVGTVQGTFPRLYEYMQMLAEETHNFRRIGGSFAEFDEAGEQYVMRQLAFMGQRAANFRLILLAGMLRGQLYISQVGDDFFYGFTDPGAGYNAFPINFQMPAGNKLQLNMDGTGNIIDVSWDDPTALILDQLLSANAAMESLTGYRLEHALVSSRVWANIINNLQIKSTAGTSNAPFEVFERATGTRPDGTPVNEFIGRLRAIPWLDFHIHDAVLEVGPPGAEVLTKLIPDTGAFLLPTPNSMWFEMLEGGEPIADYDGAPKVVRNGLYGWRTTKSDPTSDLIYQVDNAMPANYVPAATMFATVVF